MDAYKAVITKRDVRALTDDAIDEESLRKILQAGRMAGSAKATEPCRFVVVKDPAMKKKLAATGAYAGWVKDAPILIAIALEGGRMFDAGRAAQNMLIVANAEGLGSCPVTVGDDAGKLLGLPDSHRVAAVIALGHPAPDAETEGRMKNPRKPLDEYIHQERWEG